MATKLESPTRMVTGQPAPALRNLPRLHPRPRPGSKRIALCLEARSGHAATAALRVAAARLFYAAAGGVAAAGASVRQTLLRPLCM